MALDKAKVLAGRKAVDAYRTAHTKLYEHGWRKGIPEAHTPLLNIMLGAFKGLGFNTIQEFFDASELLNIQELGYKDRKDFRLAVIKDSVKDNEDRITELSPEGNALREALDRMWH